MLIIVVCLDWCCGWDVANGLRKKMKNFLLHVDEKFYYVDKLMCEARFYVKSVHVISFPFPLNGMLNDTYET